MPGIKPIVTLALILLVAGLACSLPTRGSDTPTPYPTVAVTVDPKELEDQLATAAARFRETGEITLTITEQQITSYVTQELAQQPEIPITEAQVLLQNGQITLNGTAKVGFISAQIQIVFEPSIQDGVLRMSIVSANFGSIPFPDSALEQITQMVNQYLADYIAVEGRSVLIEKVEIANGLMTIIGKAR